MKRNISCLIGLVATFCSLTVSASMQTTSVSEVGDHYPMFTVTKNINRQNLAIPYVKLDQNCQIVKSSDNEFFKFYWMMDGLNFKAMNGFLESEIRKHFVTMSSSNPRTFFVKVTDLTILKTDIPNPTLTVMASLNQAGKCQLDSYMDLGPSSKNAKLKLTEIYAEASGYFNPTPVLVTLTGTDAVTGIAIKQDYRAK